MAAVAVADDDIHDMDTGDVEVINVHKPDLMPVGHYYRGWGWGGYRNYWGWGAYYGLHLYLKVTHSRILTVFLFFQRFGTMVGSINRRLLWRL